MVFFSSSTDNTSAGIAAVLVIAAAPIELAILSISQRYSEWLNHWSNSHAWATLSLPALAFGGGLIASISPCVLALLPVQLSYLGAHQQQHPNPGKVIQFCLGVVTAYSLLGLFTSLAGTLLIDHRGVVDHGRCDRDLHGIATERVGSIDSMGSSTSSPQVISDESNNCRSGPL